MSHDNFVPRMIKSARDRRVAAARAALERLQHDAGYALRALEKGDNPSINLSDAAIRAQTALSELEAIDEIVSYFECPEVPARD